MVRELKILPQYFKEVKEGTKTFEIRKNDRGFKVGDTLILKEYRESIRMSKIANEERGIYTGQEITKVVSYILEGGQYGLEKGYCILGLKEPLNSIVLKNINLTGWNGSMQLKKMEEELQEFKEATAHHITSNTEETKTHAIEEYLDLVQSALGLLSIANISAQEVMEQYPKHLEKLKNRPRKDD